MDSKYIMVGDMINCGIVTHETQVAYVEPPNHDRMEHVVHKTIASHLEMVSPV